MTGEAIHLDSNGQAIHLQGESAPEAAQASGKRADARRNRDKILAAARQAFSEGGETSMAEISRRAGVGMATLYRNFPGRRELLEAVYADEVTALSEAARVATGETPGAALRTWLLHFSHFVTAKREVATELLTQLGTDKAVFGEGRAAGLAAGRPLLAAAQQSGEVRDDLTLEQVFDMVVAIARINADTDYVAPILHTALDGLLTPPAD
ncbi:TetR/AcrR family transcriptional regulator [Kribbella sp. DT2]|uniref:TetR/AcrR family transcriptional regulator n=1 Tax=Kribbella sp. DT2 TaxID=3393427 RepID=UPI003CF1F088